MTPGAPRIGTVVERVEEVGSTMDAARALDEDGAVVIADRQTAGRGRRGRTWHSPEGGLYLSALLKPDVEPARLGLVPLWTGLAVAGTVAVRGLEPHLRWPNDVWVGPRKLAGVLAEASVAGQRVQRVVVGVGLNVNTAQFPPDVPGTSLRMELGRAQDVDAVAAALMARMTERYRAFLDAPGAVVEDYERACSTVGRRIVAETLAGTVRGEALAVGEGGELLLRTDDGLTRLREGDVVEVGPMGPAAEEEEAGGAAAGGGGQAGGGAGEASAGVGPAEPEADRKEATAGGPGGAPP